MKKTKEFEESVEIEEVRLKPLLGMSPGLYLTILYSAIALLLIFGLFVLPGLVHGGSVVEFRSNPSGAAVYVDGVYAGSTPFDSFIDAGKHRIRMEKPFFSSVPDPAHSSGTEAFPVPGRLFAGLFFPKHVEYRRELLIEEPSAYAGFVSSKVSNWALVGSFHDGYRYPKLIAPAAQALDEAREKKGSTADLLDSFLRLSAHNLAAPEIFDDFSTALSLTEKSPRDIRADDDLLELYRTFFSSTEFGSKERAVFENVIPELPFDAYYEKAASERETTRAQPDKQWWDADMPENIRLSGHNFLRIPPGENAPLGNDEISSSVINGGAPKLQDFDSFPHTETIDGFYLDVSEVSSRQFADFLDENPTWRSSNRDALIRKGLVNEDYLLHFDPQSPAPVTCISWFAAKSYADWLSKKLIDTLADAQTEVFPGEVQNTLEVRLPGEAEWEYAARLNAEETFVDAGSGYRAPQASDFARTGRLGIADMRGNVWEWTEGWYYPSDLIDGRYGAESIEFDTADANAADRETVGTDTVGAEKSVRGGSWANDIRTVPVWKRGSQPPSWCTPFTGFRVVIAKKETEVSDAE